MRSDAELLRVLFEASEARSSDLLDCGGPAPGCSLYGFMFDLQLAPTAPAAAVALTGLQVFASHADCDYAVFVAEGTWRRKDEIHLPGSKHSCADAVKWRFVTTSPAIPSAAGGAAEDGTGGLLEAGCPIRPHALWLLLQEPILLRKDSTTAVYIHSQTSWGAICYRSSPRTNPPPPALAQMLLPVSCVNIDSPHGAGAPTQKHASVRQDAGRHRLPSRARRRDRL